MQFIKNDGGRSAAGFKGSTGDCVCRAICIATGLPYTEVYEALAQGKASQKTGKNDTLKAKRALRKQGFHTIDKKMIASYISKKLKKKTAGEGIDVKRKWFQDYMSGLGFVWVPTMRIGQGCKVHLREEELPKGRLVVSVSRHFTAVIDGSLHDTYDCSRGGNRCVYGYFILNKK